LIGVGFDFEVEGPEDFALGTKEEAALASEAKPAIASEEEEEEEEEVEEEGLFAVDGVVETTAVTVFDFRRSRARRYF
jgi:hypothetical protein